MVKPLSVRCITSRRQALRYVEAMGDNLLCTGYQSKPFLRAWLNQENAQPYFLICSKPGYGEVLLPLEMDQNGIATYCGGTHANGNFPVGAVEDIQALAVLSRAEFVSHVQAQENSPNALFLERQYERFEGVQNPFAFEASAQSPNVALSLSLEGGFEKVLERHHGKRKRKRQRSHMRKLEPMGQVEIVQHVPCERVRDVLDSFFAMKAERFKQQGICDVFQESHVREMFAQLFMESCDTDNPKHVLKAIMLDGKAISIIGCTIHRDRQTVEFGTFDSQYAACGPGDTLFYHAIEHACAEGLAVFDFGVGDELYKRSWCEIETWHCDTIIGLSVSGKLAATYRNARGGLVRRMKANPIVWTQIKNIRKRLAWLKCF